MFSGEIRQLLVQVITSWQVLAATVVLVIYASLVSYVARMRDRPNRPSRIKRKGKITKPQFTSAPEIVSDDEDLGLEDVVRE
ncbi:MAG: hypothetical protein FWB99_01040 [Treponema sp.]|nr:hypothetical protein [Treponema sp.]